MKTIKLLFLFLLGALPMQAQESEESYFEGTVTNQDGQPIQGANVCIYRPSSKTGVNEVEYHATTDVDGNYKVTVKKSETPYYFYNMTVEAEGYPGYVTTWEFTLDGSFSLFFPKDITLWNRLDFKKDQKSTIILPDTPDPMLGRYYRYDHLEGGRSVVFVREEAPQANVPYVIFPNSDFSIDLVQYDLDNLPEPTFVPFDPDDSYNPYGLYGSYTSYVGHIFVLDNTPDCSKGEVTNVVEKPNLPRVGPFRAYLYAGLGTTTDFESNCLFVGEQTGVSSITSTTDVSVFFDLQGRRLNAEPKHGVYIKNGKKVVK